MQERRKLVEIPISAGISTYIRALPRTCKKPSASNGFGKKGFRNNVVGLGFNLTLALEGGDIMANVKVYSTPTCPYCRKAQGLLERERCRFQRPQCGDRYRSQKRDGQEIRTDGRAGDRVRRRHIIGFNRAKLDQLISSGSRSSARWSKDRCNLSCRARPVT